MSNISITVPAKEGREVGLIAHADGSYTINGVNPSDIPVAEPEAMFSIARVQIKRRGVPEGIDPIEVCAFKIGTGSRAWSISATRNDMDYMEIEGIMGRTVRWSELVENAVSGSLRTYPPSGRR